MYEKATTMGRSLPLRMSMSKPVIDIGDAIRSTGCCVPRTSTHSPSINQTVTGQHSRFRWWAHTWISLGHSVVEHGTHHQSMITSCSRSYLLLNGSPRRSVGRVALNGEFSKVRRHVLSEYLQKIETPKASRLRISTPVLG